uniref:uncharacterized protein LOC122582387 n=1 Tax=Erigeron canadensis TaxID=72917 RepID=UPI001CB8F2DE|nr:uncharacterized protein LOC122582387 [Erigeron canadensis]XP_043610707.1 uncharacterized protein LOC122582387 [Erigeron canadensis]XP_043610708.1 uncharacterized protein LOC122582387 [Erigeron canadensis]
MCKITGFLHLTQPVCQIPELSGKRIRGCFHGWIIPSNHPHNNIWSFWNPSSTSSIISLPPLLLKDGDYDSIRECCLSAPPDNPNSVFLLTRTNNPTFVFCQLSPKKTKKPRWTEMSYAYQLKRITLNGRLLHSLTFCNGHIYTLSDDNCIHPFVIRVEIVVKDREVVVQLLPFGTLPYFPSERCPKRLNFLIGSHTELFHIAVGFRRETDKIPGDVYLFKCDMTSINWKELECLKNWDMTAVVSLDKIFSGYLGDLSVIAEHMWEEVEDLKEGIFVVDLACDNSGFYNPAIGSRLGGYIHIRDNMDKLIYSYHINSKTILPSPLPFSVLPTSHMLMWECWLEIRMPNSQLILNNKRLRW